MLICKKHLILILFQQILGNKFNFCKFAFFYYKCAAFLKTAPYFYQDLSKNGKDKSTSAFDDS